MGYTVVEFQKVAMLASVKRAIERAEKERRKNRKIKMWTAENFRIERACNKTIEWGEKLLEENHIDGI